MKMITDDDNHTRCACYGRRAEQDSHEVLRHLLEGIRSEEVRPLG